MWECTLFGIYDLEARVWTLDFFDDPRLFFNRDSAEEYRTLCRDYNSSRFVVREWKRP
jgi:hypothetical protein